MKSSRRKGEIQHGFPGKFKTYKKVGFKEVPELSTEEKQQEILNKMKPWVYDPSKIKAKFSMMAKATSGTPAPTPPPGFDPDAQAFFTAVENGGDTLTTTEKDATNQLVLDLKADSLWSVFDGFYPLVGGTSSSHKWNLLDPQDTEAAYRVTWLGGMTHSSTGCLGNGFNSAGNTHWNFVNESATEMSVGIYINDNMAPTPVQEYDFGAFDTFAGGAPKDDSMISIGFSDKTTKYVAFYRTSYQSTFSGTYSNGLFMGQTNGNTSQLYQNNTQLLSVSQTAAIADYPWGIGTSLRDNPFGSGNPGGVSSGARGYGTAFIGPTYLNQTQITALNTALVDFNTTLSRN